MNSSSQTSDYLLKSLKKHSLLVRINNKIKIATVSELKLNQMKSRIITDLKPIFIAFSEESRKSNNSDSDLEKMVIKYFDQRINTLPKEIIFELYDDCLTLESMGDKVDVYFLIMLNSKLRLNYSLDGWFRKKMVYEMSRNR